MVLFCGSSSSSMIKNFKRGFDKVIGIILVNEIFMLFLFLENERSGYYDWEVGF